MYILTYVIYLVLQDKIQYTLQSNSTLLLSDEAFFIDFTVCDVDCYIISIHLIIHADFI